MSQQKQNVTYLAEISISRLRAAVTGRVITPDDARNITAYLYTLK